MGVARGPRNGIITALVPGLIAVALSMSSTATAADLVNRGAAPPGISKVSTASVVGETVARPASAASYWTPAKMTSARPAGTRTPAQSLDLPDFSGEASASAKGLFTPANVDQFPQVVHGRVFFSIGTDNYTCSGTVIESLNANLIFTAGHCVYDQVAKSYVQNFIFVPGYENGTSPYGGFPAVSVYTTAAWVRNGSSRYDIGVAVLADPVEQTVSSRQIAFDLNPNGRNYTLYGYPSRPSPPFDGEILRGCHARVVGQDNMRGRIVRFPVRDQNRNVVPYPLAAKPCRMGQGASGGGWVTLGNYVNSIVSYGYCDNLPKACGYIFGPYFSDAAKALYMKGGGSPAPTIELVKAPPKVVRKRAVRFKFKGTAATLLGFYCRLDGQRKIDCSSRISIKHLRPGKHTLRVWAVDQTGHQSEEKIVHSFRVVVPRR